MLTHQQNRLNMLLPDYGFLTNATARMVLGRRSDKTKVFATTDDGVWIGFFPPHEAPAVLTRVERTPGVTLAGLVPVKA